MDAKLTDGDKGALTRQGVTAQRAVAAYEALTADNQRLRAALEAVIEQLRQCTEYGIGGVVALGQARAALAGKDGGK